MSLGTGSHRDFLQTQTQRNRAPNKWTQMDTQTLGQETDPQKAGPSDQLTGGPGQREGLWGEASQRPWV